jgi:drug/metabolite transporter (DMT)-like permease
LFAFIGWWPKVLEAIKDKKAMFKISLGAMVGSFLGVSLSLVAVQYTETGVAATIMAIVPVLVIPPTVLIKKESVSIRAVLGACISIFGAGLLFL